MTARRLLVTLGFPPWVGGIQQLMYQRCCLTPDHVCVAAPGRGLSDAWDASQPFPIWRWPGGPHGPVGWRRMWQLGWTVQAFRIHRDRVAGVELGQALPFGMIALWAQRRWGWPYAVWVYGDDVLKPGRRVWTRPVLRKVLAGANAIYAVSHFTAQLARRYGAPADRVHVVHPWPAPCFRPGNRLKARQRLGLPSDVLLLLTVARLEHRKGVPLVLRALHRLAGKWPHLRYAVVGEGPAAAAWRRLACQLDMVDKVLWTGRVPQETLLWWYQAADVFIMVPTPGPGEVEGFGIVYVEAAACGCPAIAGRNGGTPEAVLHGETGLVVPPQIEALQEAITTVLTNPTRREELGRRALMYAQHLRMKAMQARSLWVSSLPVNASSTHDALDRA